METPRMNSRLAWLPTFILIAIGLLLQACNTIHIERGAISVDCKDSKGMAQPAPGDCVGDECAGSCAPGQNASGHSAQGFYASVGTNPVPAGNTCSSGTLCLNPGMGGCNTRNLGAKCTNTYTYSTHVCNCACR